MKLLIVDDEDIIRLVIKNIVKEEKFGFDVIEEAENGEAAVRKSLEIMPDIIITDIRMPGMDGLTFIEHTHKSLPNSKFIILSGYDDFSYAQKAIKFGVCEYLLKPYSRQEMVDLLKNYIGIIREEAVIRERNQNLLKFFNSNNSVLNENQFREYLGSNDGQEKDILRLINDMFNADFSGDFYSVLYIDIDRKQQVCKEIYLDDAMLMMFAVRNITDELAKDSFECVSFETHNCGIILLLSLEGSRDDFESRLSFLTEKIRYMVKKFLHYSVTVCIGMAVDSPAMIKQCYKDVCSGIHFKLFAGNDSVLKCSKLSRRSKVFDIETSTLEGIFQSVVQADEIGFNFQIEELFRKISSSKEYDALSVKRAFSKLLIYIYNELNKQELQVDEIYGEDLSCWNTLLLIETIQELKHWLKGFMGRIMEAAASQKKGMKSKNIVTALKFINENYSSDFTLEEVAKSIHLNSNYFSELFKKEVGMNFVDYVTMLRIEAAKKLLSEEAKKVGEVAKEVGYTSQEYFCKVFKKITGLSPKNFK